jgi:glycosyltransferase involved in cell wall biosynthesis
MNKTMPTILLAAMALDLGGAETHTISLARELKRRGHRVLVASAGGRMVSMLDEASIPHVQIPMASRNPAVLFRAYGRLRRLLSEAEVGLVHAHARIPAWLTSLAIKDRPVPFITTYHGVYNAGFPWKFLTRFGQRTIAVSTDVENHLVGPLGCPPEQIRMIPNGFDTNLFRPGLDIAPLLTEFGVQAGGPHVVHASRLNDHFADAAIALVEALPLIDREVPGARLWILGDGNRADEVRQRAEEANRKLGRQAVVATGLRVDVPQFFNLADCVVAVARTATEGMACGRPVVVAGEGGYRGILTPDRLEEWAGANFTAREGGRQLNPTEIAADVVQLIRPEAAAERQRLGEAGRQYVVDHYSIEAITTEILSVYAEVL